MVLLIAQILHYHPIKHYQIPSLKLYMKDLQFFLQEEEFHFVFVAYPEFSEFLVFFS